jgi:formate--tetrahydrofolate ligase
MLTDIEIATQAQMKPIGEIAKNLGIEESEIEYYGHYKAKLSDELFTRLEDSPDGKLVLVTAINPTPAAKAKPQQRLDWDKHLASLARSQ